jgi:hypothetical protein
MSAMRQKARMLRSFVSILEREGKRDAVIALVPPDTADLMRSPPLAGSWMDATHIHKIIQAVETLGGLPAVRELARKVTDDARQGYMFVVEGVLKLFGTSPATLFKRMNSLVASFLEGTDYRYTAKTDRSGEMVVEYSADYEIPICVFVSLVPAFQTLLSACGVTGIVGPPERLGPAKVRFQIQW